MEKAKDLFWQQTWQKKRIFKTENDRLKKRKYIYITPPTINQIGFQNGDFRNYIYADIYARYYRMSGYNVLFPLGLNSISNSCFVESKLKSNINLSSMIEKFEFELSMLGIGFDQANIINMADADYTKFCQETFIDLYKKGIIERKKKSLYYSQEFKKIFQEYDVEITDGIPTVVYLGAPVVKKEISVFVLKIKDIVFDVASTINNLKISDDIKKKLIDYLKPRKYLELFFYTSGHERLKIDMDMPEYMAGISYILINPKKMDVSPFISDEEYVACEDFLTDCENKVGSVFTGIFAKNPLTEANIPIFISTLHEDYIYLGIPSICDDDYDFAIKSGLEITDILEDGILINSDFLSQMESVSAREKIMTAFADEEIGKINIRYDNTEIVISSLDRYGCLIPMLKDEITDELHILSNNLPIVFSNTFRPVIANESSISEIGNLLYESLNHLFSTGLACQAFRFYESNVGIVKPETKNDLGMNWPNPDLLILKEGEIFSSLLMPIIFSYLFDLDKLKPSMKSIISKKVLDQFGNNITKSKNNLMSVVDITNRYCADAVRLYAISDNISEDFNFAVDEILIYHQFIYLVEKTYENGFVENNFALEMAIHELIKDIKNGLMNYDIFKTVGKIMGFFKHRISNEKMSRKQGLEVLRAISVFIPHVAEEIYHKIFSGKYFINDLDFPQ